MKEIAAILILLSLLTSCGEQRETAENTVVGKTEITAENSVIGWTIVNKVDRKIKKAIQIGLETKGY